MKPLLILLLLSACAPQTPAPQISPPQTKAVETQEAAPPAPAEPSALVQLRVEMVPLEQWGHYRAKIEWSAGDEIVDGFRLYRVGRRTTSLVAVLGSEVVQFESEDLWPAKSLTYRLEALGPQGAWQVGEQEVQVPVDWVVEGTHHWPSQSRFGRLRLAPESVLQVEDEDAHLHVRELIAEQARIETWPFKEGPGHGRRGGKISISADHAVGVLDVISRGEDGAAGLQGATGEVGAAGRAGTAPEFSLLAFTHTMTKWVVNKESQAPSVGGEGAKGGTGGNGARGGDSGGAHIEVLKASAFLPRLESVAGVGGPPGLGGAGGAGGSPGPELVFTDPRERKEVHVSAAAGPVGPAGDSGQSGENGVAGPLCLKMNGETVLGCR